MEDDKLDLARKLLAEAQQRKFPLPLARRSRHWREFKADTATQTSVAVNATPDGWMGLDIGPRTIDAYRHKIAAAKTIVWNGPMGVFEMPAFAKGTLEIAKAVAAATTSGATSIVGGGDSVAAVHESGVADKISHISTGGGASSNFSADANFRASKPLPTNDSHSSLRPLCVLSVSAVSFFSLEALTCDVA